MSTVYTDTINGVTDPNKVTLPPIICVGQLIARPGESVSLPTGTQAPIPVGTYSSLLANMSQYRDGQLVFATDANNTYVVVAGLLYPVSPAPGTPPPTVSPWIAGMMMAWAATTAPEGWMLCQGQTVSRSVYQSLFSAIGTTYGAGDGINTFQLPDLRGRVFVGNDAGSGRISAQGLGQSGGEETHQLASGEMPPHKHWVMSTCDAGITTPAGSQTVYDTAGVVAPMANRDGFFGYGSYALTSDNRTGATANTAASSTTGGLDGVTQSHNNMQPFVTGNYIIKI